MSVTLKGNPIEISGKLPNLGEPCPSFTAVKNDLSEISLSDLSGQKVVLNIFPSVDTGTCAMSVRKFNEIAKDYNNVTVLNISKDLPFAQKRFCAAEGIEKAYAVSIFRSNMAEDFGQKVLTGPLKGLAARSVVIIDENHKVIYTEQVQEITSEPNYENAINSLK